MKQVISLIVATSMLMPTVVSAHSGGTDSNGCHAGSQPYHCHSSKSDDLNWEAMAIGVLLLWGLTYFTKDKPDKNYFLNKETDDASGRFYFLPHADVDEGLNPSIGLKLGVDF